MRRGLQQSLSVRPVIDEAGLETAQFAVQAGGRRLAALQKLQAEGRIWLAVSVLAGTPFGLMMFGALQFAPASHAAVFPFAAMSVMGMVTSALVLGDRITVRRATGIAVCWVG